MGKSAPDPPNYQAAAIQQGEDARRVSEAQTWANRPEQKTPWGTTSWQRQSFYDPTTDQQINRWRQTTALNPELQAALNAQIDLTRERSQLGASMTDRLSREFGKPMNWQNLPEMGGRVGVPGLIRGENIESSYDLTGPELDAANKYYGQAGDAIYNQWAERALPEQARQTESARTRLYNMGLSEGDAAFDREMTRLGQEQGDAQRQAAYQATIGAGGEAARMLGMDAATRAQLTGEQQALAQFSNQAQQQDWAQRLAAHNQKFNQELAGSQYQTQRRQQAVAERLQQRGWTLNEINALMSGQQVNMPQMPSFTSATAPQPTQYLQAAQYGGQAALDKYNAEQMGLGGMLSGLGSLIGGGAAAYGAFAASDRKIKRDITPIGSTTGGTPLYTFRYAWEPDGTVNIGVMADEVPADAVIHSYGTDYVDYSRID